MKILLAHPTGNSNVRAVLQAFDKALILAEFNTTIAVNPKAGWLKLLPESLKEQLLRRTFLIDHKSLKRHPYREMARMILPKVGLAEYVKREHCWAGIDSVYQNLDKSVAKQLEGSFRQKKVTAVYAYEDGALNVFKRAKKLGLICVYDLPIAYWETGRKLLLEEAERLPGWAPTLAGGIKDSMEKLERKTFELEMADIVVAPSEFVSNSLPAWSKGKCIIVSPFGSPSSNFRSDNDYRIIKPGKLRVLFAGSMTQRKGLGDLFEAVKQFKSSEVELIVMGTPIVSMSFYRSQFSNFTYMGNRPHEQVLELMRSCDVFCLPSIVEGRALVMQEAMSQGLPLIITANTGGQDLIEEGETGFLIPIRSPNSIAAKLQWFLHNRNQIKEMGRKAKIRAERYTWEGYGSHIVSSLSDYIV